MKFLFRLTTTIHLPRSTRRAWWPLFALAVFLTNGLIEAQVSAPEARVASASLKIKPETGGKKIEVSLRLVDDPAITVVTAAAGVAPNTTKVPTVWTSFAGSADAKCAWLVVIDDSNPNRQRTVAACVAEVRRFLAGLPAGDSVMLATLARDLNVIAPFEADKTQRDAALSQVKAAGEASLATLIYQNLRPALDDYLKARTEPRKAVVLLTDGKDETPGGPEALQAQLKQLSEKAGELGVAVHTLGFAEAATEANWFGNLKELSAATDGLHVAAGVSTRELPPQTWPTITGVMHGGGTATLDLSGLKEPTSVQMELRTASGRRAALNIEAEKVAEALRVDPPKPEPAPVTGTAPAPGTTPAPGAEPDPKVGPPPGSKPVPVSGPKPVPARSSWIWWAVGVAVVLLLIIILTVVARQKAAEEKRRLGAIRAAEQARILQERLNDDPPVQEPTRVAPKALAFLEMCDAEQTRHPVNVPSLRIGRGQHNDLVLRNDSVSGNHCVLQRDRQGGWLITDLESGNGVLVNGEKVQKAPLRHGDTFELGDLKMRFLLNL